MQIGTIGEFWTCGYHVMLGYFEMPEATAAAIDPMAGCIAVIFAPWMRAILRG